MRAVATVHEVCDVLGFGSRAQKEALEEYFLASMAGTVELPASIIHGQLHGLSLNGFRQTSLYLAAKFGNLTVFRALVAAGADPQADGLLYSAMSYRPAPEIVQYMLNELRIGLNIVCPRRELTPLMWASICGYLHCAKLLLDAGADPNIRARDGTKAFFFAAENGHINVLELLLQRGQGVHLIDGRARTALHSVVRGRFHNNLHGIYDPDNIRWMLAKGFDADARNSDGRTALDLALSYIRKNRYRLYYERVRAILLEHYKDRLVQQAASQCLHQLFHAADFTTVSDSAVLPIGTLCMSSLEVLLLQFRTDPCGPMNADTPGQRDLPLHTALRVGCPLKIVRFLVQKQPHQLRCGNSTSSLPLNVACEHGASLGVLQYLAEQEPRAVKTANITGQLPIHALCTSQPSYEAVKFLLNVHKAGIRAVTRSGDSPLSLACKTNASLPVIHLLLLADPTALLHIL